MVRSILPSIVAVVITMASMAQTAQGQCTNDPSNPNPGQPSPCQDHKSIYGGGYPYSEDFAHDIDVWYAGGPVVVTQGCAYRGGVNIKTNQAVNLSMETVVSIHPPVSAPAGSRFQIRYRIDTISTDASGNKYVSATTLRGDYQRTLTGVYPQTETTNAVYPNLPAGEYNVKMEMVLWDGGFGTQFRVDFAYTTLHGVPASTYPAGTNAIGTTTTVTGAWQQITNTLNFTTTVPTHLYVYGFFQVNSGTPGQQLALGFSLDGASSVHTIEVGVPSTFPQGINLYDHYKNKPGFVDIPAGNHSISLWAINRHGGSTVLQYRQVEFFAIPARSDTPIFDTESTSPTLVSLAGDANQPKQVSLMLDGDPNGPVCGRWTKLAQLTYPATNVTQNLFGEVYVEFPAPSDQQILDGTAPDPGADPVYQIAVEARYGDPNNPLATAEFGMVVFSIPTEFRTVSGVTRRVAKRSQYTMQWAPLWWGTGQPNTLLLWVRKITCGASGGQVMAGKRYFSATAIPSDGWTKCAYD